MATDADRAYGVRLAVEDLTAMVSDVEGDTVGLADERWNAFVARLLACGGVAEGVQLGQRLIGYREVSFMLVVELASARMASPRTVMETVGLWATTLGE